MILMMFQPNVNLVDCTERTCQSPAEAQMTRRQARVTGCFLEMLPQEIIRHPGKRFGHAFRHKMAYFENARSGTARPFAARYAALHRCFG